MNNRALDRELKKGSAELIILSIVEPRARHGYEISRLRAIPISSSFSRLHCCSAEWLAPCC
jgi:hypothetical protein